MNKFWQILLCVFCCIKTYGQTPCEVNKYWILNKDNFITNVTFGDTRDKGLHLFTSKLSGSGTDATIIVGNTNVLKSKSNPTPTAICTCSTTTGNVVFEQYSDVDFRSPKAIVFTNGVTIKSGARVHAYITPLYDIETPAFKESFTFDDNCTDATCSAYVKGDASAQPKLSPPTPTPPPIPPPPAEASHLGRRWKLHWDIDAATGIDANNDQGEGKYDSNMVNIKEKVANSTSGDGVLSLGIKTEIISGTAQTRTRAGHMSSKDCVALLNPPFGKYIFTNKDIDKNSAVNDNEIYNRSTWLFQHGDWAMISPMNTTEIDVYERSHTADNSYDFAIHQYQAGRQFHTGNSYPRIHSTGHFLSTKEMFKVADPTLSNVASQGLSPITEFHEYALEWDEHEIRFLIDDFVTYRFPNRDHTNDNLINNLTSIETSQSVNNPNRRNFPLPFTICPMPIQVIIGNTKHPLPIPVGQNSVEYPFEVDEVLILNKLTLD